MPLLLIVYSMFKGPVRPKKRLDIPAGKSSLDFPSQLGKFLFGLSSSAASMADFYWQAKRQRLLHSMF